MIKEFRNYLKWKKEKARMAKAEGNYLLNAFADFTLLEDLINRVKAEHVKVTVITLDGTRCVLEYVDDNKRRKVDWER